MSPDAQDQHRGMLLARKVRQHDRGRAPEDLAGPPRRGATERVEALGQSRRALRETLLLVAGRDHPAALAGNRHGQRREHGDRDDARRGGRSEKTSGPQHAVRVHSAHGDDDRAGDGGAAGCRREVR